jgi:hypothetical protein
MKKLLTLTIALVIFPTMLLSQTSGKVSGTILNEEGAPLAGANVSIVGTSNGGATDANGKYFILDVPAGAQSVRVDYIGYKSVTMTNVSISVNLTTNLDFSLEIAALEGEAVEIVAERPIINTSATNTTRTIDKDIIQNVAIRGIEI